MHACRIPTKKIRSVENQMLQYNLFERNEKLGIVFTMHIFSYFKSILFFMYIEFFILTFKSQTEIRVYFVNVIGTFGFRLNFVLQKQFSI